MMRSLYSRCERGSKHATKMDVIGNNIANVNTVGFKSSSVNFSDTFYQTMSDCKWFECRNRDSWCKCQADWSWIYGGRPLPLI